MKKITLILLTFFVLHANAQILIYPQVPPSGLTLKNQLWNMLVVNSSTANKRVHIELKLAELPTNLQVLSGQTAVFNLIPGNQQLQVSTVNPVQYNILNPSYTGFVSSDFLPIGNFLACYSFYEHVGDAITKIGEECVVLEIQPMAPPKLVYPYDQSTIETANPQFNWLAPAPLNLFTNLNYDLELVEVYSNQSAADAIRINMPIHRAFQLNSLQYLYPLSAPALQPNTTYAWRVIAKNNQSVIAPSETWKFKLAISSKPDNLSSGELPFVKLKKEDEAGYAVCIGYLRFEYYNETADTGWQTVIYDLSANRKEIRAPFENIPLKPGANLIQVDLKNIPDFIEKHLYVLELKNSRNETWRLRFEYRLAQD